MQIKDVTAALAAQAATIGGLNAYDHVPHSVSEPAFVVVDTEITYDVAYNRCADRLRVTCAVLVGRTDDVARSADLYAYASPGAFSLKDALETEPTLDGACNDLTVTVVRIPRVFPIAGNEYWAAEFTVEIEGDGA